MSETAIETLFRAARSFERAAHASGCAAVERMAEGHRTGAQPPFAILLPGYVLDAFAAELYLKCLLLVGGKTPPPTHRLDVLYDKLPEALRDLARGESADPEAFDSSLREGASTFVELRYSHEWFGNSKPPTFTRWRFGVVAAGGKNAIIMRRPDLITALDEVDGGEELRPTDRAYMETYTIDSPSMGGRDHPGAE